jgi:ubiquinone/menaquinone biosynthesis C-methylase UbiE
LTEFAKGYSRDAALRFPFLPEEHETAWRYVFDWAVCGEALGCAPGDLVLEFAAGPGYASELFNRLGYRTVALDVNPEILAYARERLDVDARLDSARAGFVAGDGEHLPFRDASFDGLVCLNALHHMLDYRSALAEMRRVLKPGGRAVFSEPGRTHAEAGESKLAVEQYGTVEKSVCLDEVYRLAREVGFERMILKPFVYPEMVELDYREFGRYRFHLSSAPLTRPDQIARFFVDFHALFALAAPGERPLTSARPRARGGLKASLRVEGTPARAAPGDPITARVAVQNRGPHVWLSAPRAFGGRVALGVRICRTDGRAVAEAAREFLAHDVAPEEGVEIETRFRLPWLEAGDYLMRFDMLSERLGWFQQFGSTPESKALNVVAAAPTSACPRILRAEIALGELPARARPGEAVRVRARVRNTGDTLWLSAPHQLGGWVSFGLKLISLDGRLLADALGRTAVPSDVPPGGEVEVESAFEVPPGLEPGGYRLRFDMVDEQIAWFEQLGSPVAERELAVER